MALDIERITALPREEAMPLVKDEIARLEALDEKELDEKDVVAIDLLKAILGTYEVEIMVGRDDVPIVGSE